MTKTLVFRKEDEDIFNLIKDGLKTIETRAGSETYLKISAGDTLVFACQRKRFKKMVDQAYRFKTIDAMLKKLGYKKISPLSKNRAELKKKILSFPNYKEKIKKYGILAFKLK